MAEVSVKSCVFCGSEQSVVHGHCKSCGRTNVGEDEPVAEQPKKQKRSFFNRKKQEVKQEE